MKGDSSVAHPISLDHPTPAIQEPATNLIKIPSTAPSIPVNIQKLQIDALSSRIESMTEVNDNLVNK